MGKAGSGPNQRIGRTRAGCSPFLVCGVENNDCLRRPPRPIPLVFVGDPRRTSVGGPHRSGRFLEALRLLPPETPSSHETLSVENRVLRGELLQLTGSNKQSSETVRRVLGSRPSTDIRARCELVLGQVCLERENPARSVKHFKRALRLATDCGEVNLVCLARAKLLTTLSEVASASSLEALLRETKKAISAFGDDQAAADFHTRAAQIEATRGDFSKAKDHLQVSRAYLKRSPNIYLEGCLDVAASAVHFRASDLLTARGFAASALKHSLTCGHARTRMVATANLGLLDLQLGDLAEAEEEIRAALDLSECFPASQISLLDSYAQLELVRGRTSRCRELLDEIDLKIKIHEPSVFSWQQLAVGTTRVRLLLVLGEWCRAKDLANSLSNAADKRSDGPHRLAFRILGADALLELRRFGDAARLVNEAAELADDAPLALSAEVDRAQAAVLARTNGGEGARRQFQRSFRILSSIGGIAPRMDAALSFQRTMQPDDELSQAIRKQPWNLQPLIAGAALESGSRTDCKALETNSKRVAVDISDAVALGRLASRPRLLAQEASVLLRDSGRVRAVATVERRKDGSRRVLAHDGWTKEEAHRRAAQMSDEVKIPIGETDGSELELVIAPRDDIQATTFLRDFDTMVRQWRSLESFQRAERAQMALISSP